jgi:hypothetical protein
MKKKPWRIRRHPERPLVADEMHLVSASRQFFTECRGENAAPADGRITRDANLQWPR